MSESVDLFDRLALAELDEVRQTVSDPRLEAILLQTCGELVAALRRCSDALEKLDCTGNPELALRVRKEADWLHVVTLSLNARQ